MKNRRIVRSAASVILSLTLLFTSVIPETLLVNTVYAKETDNTVTILPGTDEAGTGTGKMSITLKVKKKIEPVVALAGWNYGGIPNSPKITSGNPGNGTVTYYYKVKGADDSTYSETIPTAQGNYTVKADIAETEEYYRGSATADFTIGSQTMSMKITLNIHKHNFTYESDGAKITAVCSADGCELENKTVSLTLKAPERKIDTDNDSAEATIEGLDEFDAETGLDVSVAQIEYYSGSTKLDEAPITKGNYTAKLTVGEENNKATATVDYSIGTSTQTHGMTITLVIKGDSTITKTPTAKELTYSGLAQELVVAGETEDGEMYYALGENATAVPDFDGTSEASDKKWNTSIPKATDVGTYYIWYKVVGDENHLDSDVACVTSKIRADISKTVTFKVVNGSWDDGEAKDKVVKLEGFEGDTLKLSADKIPSVGTKPSDGYKEGSWDEVPKADTEIKADTTYTYTYAKKEEVKPEPIVEPAPAEKIKLTVTAKDQTIAFGAAISQASSKYTIKGLQTGDKAEVTLKADMKKFTITPQVTVKSGDKDVTDNYDIEAVEGKLAIKQVPMVMAIAKGNSIKATTYKIANVDGYLIYTGYCGGTAKLVKTIKGNKAVSYTYKKIAGKALNRKKASKVIVKAYCIVDSKKVVVATSMTAHVAGAQDKKLTNASNITVKAEKLDLKKGNTVNIGAKVSLVAKKKAQLSKGHAAELRYASSNKAVATIDANGKIKAFGKGTCTVYAVAVDGARKAVKVTVK